MTLPLFHTMTDEQQDIVTNAFNALTEIAFHAVHKLKCMVFTEFRDKQIGLSEDSLNSELMEATCLITKLR